jgi:hypothetical protein
MVGEGRVERGGYIIFMKYDDVVEEDDGVETETNSRTVKIMSGRTVKRISTGGRGSNGLKGYIRGKAEALACMRR